MTIQAIGESQFALACQKFLQRTVQKPERSYSSNNWFIMSFIMLTLVITPESHAGFFDFLKSKDKIEWQKSSQKEVLTIKTPQTLDLMVKLSQSALEIRQGGLFGNGRIFSFPWPLSPIVSVGNNLSLTSQNTAASLSQGQNIYFIQGSQNQDHKAFIIQGTQKSLLVLRINFNQQVYDVITSLETNQKLNSLTLDLLPQQEPSVQKVQLKLNFSDSNLSGVYEFSLANGNIFTVENLIRIKSPLQLLKEAKEEIKKIQDDLKTKVFGQDPVIEKLSKHVLETKTNGMKKPKVLVAMGPSGVGKSYSAKLLADRVYQDPKYVMEISGNEFNSGTHSLDYMKLLGGTKGSNVGQEGSLITWLKQTQGKGVLIVNEGDKMNEEIWKRLMEFLEKGRLTDSEGKEVWGKEVIIIITSNRGATRLFPSSVAQWNQQQIDTRLRQVTQDELKSYYLQKDGLNDNFQLPREIINRVDEFIPFGPLSQEAALQIAKSSAKEFTDEFKQKYQIQLELQEELIKHIALTGFKSSDDARQIRNQIKNFISLATQTLLDQFNLSEGDTIKAELKKQNNEFFAQMNYQSELVTLPIKNIPNENALRDQNKKNLLLNLEASLKAEIFGQDDNIKLIANSLIGYALDTEKERPYTLGLFGPSGTGKTEIGKAIARTFYGESSQIAVLPMGNIANFSDFDTLFGSPAQFQGGDVEREFEKALRENPNGGVIIMDEISNMGGSDPRLKEALFKKLYDLFEEGKYISPRDNRRYDLKKYHFILTGNDGEAFFLGMTADDLLLTTWKNLNKPTTIREILRQSNLPNAFINRIGTLLIMKPLLRDEVAKITVKLWDKQIARVKRANPGLIIKTEDQFIEKLTHAVYSSDQGGRSVRKVLEKSVAATLGLTLLRSGIDTENLEGVTLKIGIKDNPLKKPYVSAYYKGRQLSLETELIKNNTSVFKDSMNITEMAESQILLSQKSAKLTAYHEAGHAIANNPELTHQIVSYITIRGGSTGQLNYYGYARYSNYGSGGGNPDYQSTVAQIARLWAGRKAQELAGFTADAGWTEDLNEIRKLASNYLTVWGLDRDFIALPIDEKGKPTLSGPTSERFIAKMDQLIAEGEYLAEKSLKAQWRLVRAVTAELLLKGNITGERFLEIQNNIKGPLPSALRADENYTDYLKRTNRSCSKIFFY